MKKYAWAFQEVSKTIWEGETHGLVNSLQGYYDDVMNNIQDSLGSDIQSDFWIQDTWIYWDLGKQEYFSKNPKEQEQYQSAEGQISYTVISPFTEKDEAKRVSKLQEVLDRHIGWEVIHAYFWWKIEELSDVAKYISQIVWEVFPNEVDIIRQERNQKMGQDKNNISSYEYFLIGKRLREKLKIKDLAPENLS